MDDSIVKSIIDPIIRPVIEEDDYQIDLESTKGKSIQAIDSETIRTTFEDYKNSKDTDMDAFSRGSSDNKLILQSNCGATICKILLNKDGRSIENFEIDTDSNSGLLNEMNDFLDAFSDDFLHE